MKVPVDHDSLRILFERAQQAGTLDKWGELALSWAFAADQEISRLTARVKELEGVPHETAL